MRMVQSAQNTFGKHESFSEQSKIKIESHGNCDFV